MQEINQNLQDFPSATSYFYKKPSVSPGDGDWDGICSVLQLINVHTDIVLMVWWRYYYSSVMDANRSDHHNLLPAPEGPTEEPRR